MALFTIAGNTRNVVGQDPDAVRLVWRERRSCDETVTDPETQLCAVDSRLPDGGDVCECKSSAATCTLKDGRNICEKVLVCSIVYSFYI